MRRTHELLQLALALRAVRAQLLQRRLAVRGLGAQRLLQLLLLTWQPVAPFVGGGAKPCQQQCVRTEKCTPP